MLGRAAALYIDAGGMVLRRNPGLDCIIYYPYCNVS
jgi:hypothetical protein